jgi:hypothetical protein
MQIEEEALGGSEQLSIKWVDWKAVDVESVALGTVVMFGCWWNANFFSRREN